MFTKISIAAVLLACTAPAEAGSLPVTENALIGTWDCGPTKMKGPDFVMSVVSATKFGADRTFVNMTTNLIEPAGKSAITIITSSRGTWRMEGTTLVWIYQESKFISSSNPAITPELGQKFEDDDLRKKSVYKSKILEISQDLLRRIPINSAHPEAVVEARCRRTPSEN